jgi:predicted HicB family RNase H-like nuclease
MEVERMKTKNFPLRLDEYEHKQLKLFCVQHGVSMQEFVIKAIRKELEKKEVLTKEAV